MAAAMADQQAAAAAAAEAAVATAAAEAEAEAAAEAEAPTAEGTAEVRGGLDASTSQLLEQVEQVQ